MNAHRLPVVTKAEDLVLHTGSSCFECRHAWEKGHTWMKCGAQGGKLCETLNLQGDCALFVRTTRREAVLRWWLLFLFLGMISALALFGLHSVAGLSSAENGLCRTTWRQLVDSTREFECEHPDHKLVIEEGVAICRCSQRSGDS